MRKVLILMVIVMIFETLPLVTPKKHHSESHTPPYTITTSPTTIPKNTEINNTIDNYKLWHWEHREFTPSPIPFTDASAIAINEKIYVVGGKNNELGHLRQLLIYDTILDLWTSGPNLPSSYPAVENPVVTAYNGEIYAFGGQTGPFSGAVNNSAKFSPQTGKWTILEDMPTARGGHGADIIGNLIYVVGGMNSSGQSLKTVEAYNVKTGKWSTLPSLVIPTDNPGVIALSGKIYVFGGRTRFLHDVLNTVEVFDPETKIWSFVFPSMPTARRAVLVTSLHKKRAIIMGGQSDYLVFSANEMFDSTTNTWYTLPPLPVARHGPAGDRVGNQIFVLGGSLEDFPSGDDPTDIVYVFRL